LLTFGISSVVLLLVLRRWFRSRFFGYVGDEHDPESNIDRFEGQTVKVIAAIDADHDEGKVEFKGAAWKATSDTTIPEGKRAVIVAVDGISLKVRPE
jgi:membrane protein implicated in regulation of membrane protease activity